ncbi:AAA family ATPase [Micromonospora sp. WMMD882]|uniref:MinD/ParA family ATP-binding protein n=1 Tax=Micromonospora sp. WMMD882 TaxID=3015151 RepID=UPI00248BEC75|nr:AAA family ATPase [Micromonospora sp. WMMD882]WBB82242.1 AAA family ATPase [Micromonospora sp. WMMD882]
MGYRSEAGRRAEAGYRAGPGYRADRGHRAEPAYQPEPPYQAEPAYQAEPPYQPEPAYQVEPEPQPRSELARRTGPGYPVEPVYRAGPPHPANPVGPTRQPGQTTPGGLTRQPDPAQPAGPTRQVGPGYQAEPAYRADAGYQTEPAYLADRSYPAEPKPPAESRYALLEQYRHNPAGHAAESRYRTPDNGYRQEPGHPPVAARAAVPTVTDRGYPARLEWRPPVAAGSDQDRAAAILRRDFGSPRVLAFANPKGGVHKTTATVLAAATIGSVRGRGVLAWDDNELRGTLGLRAGSARHARTIRHLINDLATIEITQGADLTEQLDDYLRHASDGSYDVLAGEESPRFAQKLDKHTVQRVLDLLRRTHDVICVDTGNNVESANWRTVMQAADQLVLTTVPREDAAFSADWMLDWLHEVGMGELADNAVTLLSCPNPERSSLLDDFQRHFATRTRAVTVVPYDPALETGSSIEYHQLQPETRQAWLRAAGVMLEPFGR